MFKNLILFFYKARVKEHQANEHDSQWIPLLTDKFRLKKIFVQFQLETNRNKGLLVYCTQFFMCLRKN